MKRWTGPLLVMTAIALFTHWLTLAVVPSVIMDRAIAALEARGVALHRFTVPVRVTPQTQQIVRSSPDLYYALCRYDLSRPESGSSVPRLTVAMGAWENYQSLSFFDARTNNFTTIRGSGKAIKIELWPSYRDSGAVKPVKAVDAEADYVVYTPTDTGVILIRRLAPTGDAFTKAVAAGEGDECTYKIDPNTFY